ncbi:LysR substrate-binding domain-containing protein [Frateuria aurantia]
MSRIPLAQLQHFAQVARHGNLSRAAEQAHVTVSALSHQIRQLEGRLDRQLFERVPRGMVLTEAGRQLLEAIGGHLEGIERAMRDYQCRHEDRVSLTAIPGMMTGWLVPRLSALVRLHPELQLDLSSNSALVDFEREPLDLGLRYGMGTWPGVVSERLFGEWVVPVAAPTLLRGWASASGRLAELPLLGDRSDKWSYWFEQTGDTPPARYLAHFDNVDSLQRAALEGMGVALGRMVMAQPLIEAGVLQVIGQRYLQIREAYYLVYPERSRTHRGVQRFRDWLLPEAARYESQLRQRVESSAARLEISPT